MPKLILRFIARVMNVSITKSEELFSHIINVISLNVNL